VVIFGDVVIALWKLYVSYILSFCLIEEKPQYFLNCICIIGVHVTIQVEDERGVAYFG